MCNANASKLHATSSKEGEFTNPKRFRHALKGHCRRAGFAQLCKKFARAFGAGRARIGARSGDVPTIKGAFEAECWRRRSAWSGGSGITYAGRIKRSECHCAHVGLHDIGTTRVNKECRRWKECRQCFGSKLHHRCALRDATEPLLCTFGSGDANINRANDDIGW